MLRRSEEAAKSPFGSPAKVQRELRSIWAQSILDPKSVYHRVPTVVVDVPEAMVVALGRTVNWTVTVGAMGYNGGRTRDAVATRPIVLRALSAALGPITSIARCWMLLYDYSIGDGSEDMKETTGGVLRRCRLILARYPIRLNGCHVGIGW